MTRTTAETADDYCDQHLVEIRHDQGEADPDGRIKTADTDYASILLVEELLHNPAFIESLGFDPHTVLLTRERTAQIVALLPSFSPICCHIGARARERVIRKSRHPPIEYELERRGLTRPSFPTPSRALRVGEPT